MRQLVLALPKWGGRRKGAGRPRNRPHPGLDGPGVPHLRRPKLSKHHPVHVTQRLQQGVGYLRTQSRSRIVEEALRETPALHVVHYSIQGNHLHLIVEADSAEELARAMQAFSIRLAKRLNRRAGRRGSVFVDRYHAHALTSRRAVANAVRYVEGNVRHHAREPLPRSYRDPFSSAANRDGLPVSAPRTWLLRVGWRLEPAGRAAPEHEP